eukprot:TRINITY_DN899_c0_g1_i1.p1 TRINITY_DN899_c0_g1~~TRINITY_DN899_c0_g1_i1.p1  ORF type:complete len:1494 (+),score=277.61 TRINITY_DN899_c0_g1_i1:56-4537(+)
MQVVDSFQNQAVSKVKHTEECKKYFSLKKNEVVVQCYTCTLDPSLRLGTLYVCQHSLCFKSSDQKLQLDYSNVVYFDVSFTSTLKRMKVVTNGGGYTFSGFFVTKHAREAYNLITYLWKNPPLYFEQSSIVIENGVVVSRNEEEDNVPKRKFPILSSLFYYFGFSAKSVTKNKREQKSKEKISKLALGDSPIFEIEILYKKNDDSLEPALLVLEQESFKCIDPESDDLIDRGIEYRYEMIDSIVMRARHEHMDIRFVGHQEKSKNKQFRLRMMSSYLQIITTQLYLRSTAKTRAVNREIKVIFEQGIRKFDYTDDRLTKIVPLTRTTVVETFANDSEGAELKRMSSESSLSANIPANPPLTSSPSLGSSLEAIPVPAVFKNTLSVSFNAKNTLRTDTHTFNLDLASRLEKDFSRSSLSKLSDRQLYELVFNFNSEIETSMQLLNIMHKEINELDNFILFMKHEKLSLPNVVNILKVVKQNMATSDVYLSDMRKTKKLIPMHPSAPPLPFPEIDGDDVLDILAEQEIIKTQSPEIEMKEMGSNTSSSSSSSSSSTTGNSNSNRSSTSINSSLCKINLLCEDGAIVDVACPLGQTTFNSLKDIVSENFKGKYDSTKIKRVRFKIPGAGFIKDERVLLEKSVYFMNCLKRSITPVFMLVTDGSDYYMKFKHEEGTLTLLLGPLVQQTEESIDYRQFMITERKKTLEKPTAKRNRTATLQSARKAFSAQSDGSDILELERDIISTNQLGEINESDLLSRMQDKFKSVYELDNNYLRVKILSCDKIPFSDTDVQYSIAMTVYHGEQAITPILCSVPAPHNVTKWSEHLTTNLRLSDVPKETKLCFMLLKKKKNRITKAPSTSSQSSSSSTTLSSTYADCVCWINSYLFDHKSELKTGVITLKMWVGNEPNFLTPCGQNDHLNAPELTIELDSFPFSVLFPSFDTSVLSPTSSTSNLSISSPRTLVSNKSLKPDASQEEKLQKIFSYHSLVEMTNEEKRLVWAYRQYCTKHPQALPKVYLAMNKADKNARLELYSLLAHWAPITQVEALELLGMGISDQTIRTYAVDGLEKTMESSEDLEYYLLQLVQSLRFEMNHNSALSRLLYRFAVKFTSSTIGHYICWYLKSELHDKMISERFSLLLESILLGRDDLFKSLLMQDLLQKKLCSIISTVKEQGADPKDALQKLNENWPGNCVLPLNPKFVCKGIKVEKCKVMDSAQKPLWLVFENADPTQPNSTINVIFKAGDDLRQDMLVIQMFKLMDRMWKKEGLDLKLNPYSVIATGGDTGMIEVVTNSQTISKIQKEMAGDLGALKDECLFQWLLKENKESLNEKTYEKLIESFSRSCSGYSVATYVLGIGDRHNSNIMMKRDGHLFHIDFGHILGNFKKKFGIRRERVPLVFTPDFAYVLGGNKDSPYYVKFITLSILAYGALQKNHKIFINLFCMMLLSGMPELQKKEDVMYIADTLAVDEGKDFATIVSSTGSQLSTRVNWLIHNLAHK